MLKILFLSLFLILHSHAAAEDKANVAGLRDYLARMLSAGKPAILIVGCGHKYKGFGGQHNHPDCWCVDSNNIEHNRCRHYFAPQVTGYVIDDPAKFVETVGADAELDITGITHQDYVEQFDEVVLELVTSGTLGHPNCLYNATRYLKTHGKLYVEAEDLYNCPTYARDITAGAKWAIDGIQRILTTFSFNAKQFYGPFKHNSRSHNMLLEAKKTEEVHMHLPLWRTYLTETHPDWISDRVMR